MEVVKRVMSQKAKAYLFRSRGRPHTIKGTGGSFSIITHKAYQYYIKNSKLANRKDVSDYVEHGKIISMFYKIAGEKLVEAKGGLYLDGLGYFGIIQEMKKVMYHDKITFTRKMNPKTDNIIYNLGYVPIDKENSFKTWVFDYCFVQSIKQALCVSLKSGNKYSFNASLFYNNLRKTGNDL